jgi:homocysteine S-methyltransferase
VARVAASIPSVAAVGINCTPARLVTPLARRLRNAVSTPVIVYPNAGGRWDATARAWLDDAGTHAHSLAEAAEAWLGEGASWVGGCCGFGLDAIEALALRLQNDA